MPGYRSLLGQRSFLPYLLGGAFSFAAPSTLLVVLVWATAVAYPASEVLHQDYSALALALLGLAATVPTLGSAVVSGAFADRFNRRRIMATTNVAALLAAAALSALLMIRPSGTVALPGPSGFYLPTWLVLALPLWAIVEAAVTLFRPAFNATLPTLLPTGALGAANGLIYGVAVPVSIAGSLGATALISIAGEGEAILIPIALLLVTAIALVGIRSPPPTPSAPRPRFTSEVTEGYRYIWQHRAILEITVSSLAINFLSAIAFVELGLYTRDWLGVGQAILLGAIVTGASAGSGVGTLLAGRIRFEPRAGRYLTVLIGLQGVTIVALAFSRSIDLSIGIMFLFGLFPGMATTIFLATIQATVPNRLLGRVLAADEVGSMALIPVGQYTGGIVTVAEGIQSTYLGVGAGTIAIGIGMALLRDLRRLGFEPDPARASSGAPAPPPAPPAETAPGGTISPGP